MAGFPRSCRKCGSSFFCPDALVRISADFGRTYNPEGAPLPSPWGLSSERYKAYFLHYQIRTILYNNYCFFRNLFVGYLGAIVYNLRRENKAERFPLSWLLAIGVLVQFGWEAGLLLGGIRSAGFSAEARLLPLIVNSLLETNLGMPYIYAIYIAYSRRFTEQLRPREKVLSFRARVAENNGQLNPLKLSRM